MKTKSSASRVNAATRIAFAGVSVAVLLVCGWFGLNTVSASKATSAKAKKISESDLSTKSDGYDLRDPLARKEYLHNPQSEGFIDFSSGSMDGGPLAASPGLGDDVDLSLSVILKDGYTRVHAVAVQADGKILVGGTFPLVNGVVRNGLVRLNTDGTIDLTFNQGNLGSQADDIRVLSDGRIFIGGCFTSYNGVARGRVARLNSDGSLDPTFDVGLGPNNCIIDMLPQPDGKLVIAGNFTQFNGVAANRIIRLNANGTLDSSFTPPTISAAIQEMVIQPDGRIIIGGQFNLVNGITRTGTARLNTNGTHDTSFDPLTNTGTGTYSLALQPDGKVIVGGAYGGTPALTLRRLNPDGSLDAGFNPPVVPPGGSTIHSIIVLPDSRILVAGFLNDGFDDGYGVVRLNADGSVDGTFTPQLTVLDGLEVFSIALAPGGQIVGGGDFYRLGSGQSKHVFRINSDGSTDTGFTTEIAGFGTARTTARQPDGKIFVAGAFKSVNDQPRLNLVRLNVDGTLDPTFVGESDQEVYTLALQSDGKLISGGPTFGNSGGVVRYNPDGTPDPTFQPASDIILSFVYKILIQPDGKIIGVGNLFTPRAPGGQTGVYRVNSNGSEDATFTLNAYGGQVLDLALLTDGRIYISGGFVNYAGSGLRNLVRLGANGVLDPTFNTGIGTNNTGAVYAIAERSNGKVAIGGLFSTFNGRYAKGLTQLNSDGSADTSFDPGLGTGAGGVYDLYMRPDDKLMVGGVFATFDGQIRRNIARVNFDGSLDDLFTDQTDNYVWNINPQSDGKFLISGGFNNVNGVLRTGVARLEELVSTPPSNDNFSGATVITGNVGGKSGNNADATAEPGEPAHAGTVAAHSVWYRWTAPIDGLFSFTTSGSSFDTTMGIYTGSSVSVLTEVASNDDSTLYDQTSRIVFRATAGAEYFIAVDGKNGETGIVNLIWRQSARTYRIYAQTGNGNISPRIPTIIATRSGNGAQYAAQPISAGVFELDLPVDNATYTVAIGGADIWAPNSFTIDNSGSPDPARVTNGETGAPVPESPTTGGINLVVVARTVSATVSGVLQGLTSVNGVTVFLGFEGGPNPIAPEPCAVSVGGTGAIVYACQFIVDTRHQIKPSLGAIVFAPVNRQFPEPVVVNIIPGPGTLFTAGAAPTFNIGGQVSANGSPLDEASVYLTGSKIHSFITAVDGNFAFNNLPAGGDYLVSVVAPGYTFAPQAINNLQSNQFLTMAAQGSCSYSISTPSLIVPAAGGEQHFAIETEAGCPWAVTNPVPWITFNTSVGNGPANIYFTSLPNNGMPRTAAISVANQQVMAEQANGCTFSLTGGTLSFPAAGGTGSLTITPSDQGCTWTPAASDYCMISGLSGGAGTGQINYTVGTNQGVARTGAISAGGQIVSIDQAAAAVTHPVRFDFDGDKKADIAVYRPSNGVWYVLNSSSPATGVSFGLPDDVRVAADYDGDGKTDVAVYRPSIGAWYRYNSSTGEFIAIAFGLPGDLPSPGDYDGDGKTDIAVYRPSTGTWYQLNTTTGFQAITFGLPEDVPASADFDGDGKTDIALFRASSGIWFILGSTGGFSAVQFGAEGDIRTQGDYDGDGKADVAVFRPSNSYWYRLNSTNGEFIALQFGLAGDIPVPADYNGDQSTDIAVYRPSSNLWFVWSCTTNPAISTTLLGTSEDIPIAVPITP